MVSLGCAAIKKRKSRCVLVLVLVLCDGRYGRYPRRTKKEYCWYAVASFALIRACRSPLIFRDYCSTTPRSPPRLGSVGISNYVCMHVFLLLQCGLLPLERLVGAVSGPRGVPRCGVGVIELPRASRAHPTAAGSVNLASISNASHKCVFIFDGPFLLRTPPHQVQDLFLASVQAPFQCI